MTADQTQTDLETLDDLLTESTHDWVQSHLRDSLIRCTDDDANDELCALLKRLLNSGDKTARTQLTELCLSLELCPLHRVDYAICFDDDDEECRAIRLVHP